MSSSTISDLSPHAALKRVYVWFCDFAPPDTLAAFGETVIGPLGAPRNGPAAQSRAPMVACYDRPCLRRSRASGPPSITWLTCRVMRHPFGVRRNSQRLAETRQISWAPFRYR